MPGTFAKLELREINPTCILVTCAGGLSWEDRAVLAAEVERHLTEHPATTGVILDLGEVRFVNSAGLGALFQLIRIVRQRGGRVVFANVPPMLSRMFGAVGIDRLAVIARDVKAALQEFESPQLDSPEAPVARDGAPPVS